MTSDNKTSVIIIGAGPSGLSLALQLKELGQDSLILESGSKIGNSWSEMPDYLSLVSLWKSNYLLKKDKRKFPMLSQVTAKNFQSYLEEIARSNDLNIILNAKVLGVAKENGIFEVKTEAHSYFGHSLVNATGYYSFPFIPNYPGLEETEVHCLHIRNYKNLSTLNNAKKVLVVGSKLSAGQVLLELANKKIDISISSRSKIVSMSPPPFFQLGLLFIDYLEKPIQSLKEEKIPTSAPMPYDAKKLIDSKKVRLLPKIKSFHKNAVTFEDGATEPFDSVIFATGFRPKFDYLGELVEIEKTGLPRLSNTFEALYCKGLFFLGLDHQCSIQSRFLRGIRTDALELAKIIHQKSKF